MASLKKKKIYIYIYIYVYVCMLPHMIQGYLIGIIFPLGTVADQHTVVPPQLCQWSVISWALETVMVKTFSLIL